LLNLMHYNYTNDLGSAWLILIISNHKWYLFRIYLNFNLPPTNSKFTPSSVLTN